MFDIFRLFGLLFIWKTLRSGASTNFSNCITNFSTEYEHTHQKPVTAGEDYEQEPLNNMAVVEVLCARKYTGGLFEILLRWSVWQSSTKEINIWIGDLHLRIQYPFVQTISR